MFFLRDFWANAAGAVAFLTADCTGGIVKAAIVALLLTVPAQADDRDRAAAAIAMAKAIAETRDNNQPGSHAHTSYRAAAKESRETGKPIFISVNTDCSRLCKELSSEYIVMHAKQFASDGVTPLDRPRLLLTLPHATLDRQWCLGQWDTLPTADEVRRAERRLKPTIPAAESVPLRKGEMRVYEGTPAFIPELPPVYAPFPAPPMQRPIIQVPRVVVYDAPRYQSIPAYTEPQWATIPQASGRRIVTATGTITCGPNG